MTDKLNQALSTWFARLRTIPDIKETSGYSNDDEDEEDRKKENVAYVIYLRRYSDPYFEFSDKYRHYLSIQNDPKLDSDKDKFPPLSIYIPKSINDPLDFLPTSEEYDCINDSNITLEMKKLTPIVKYKEERLRVISKRRLEKEKDHLHYFKRCIRLK